MTLRSTFLATLVAVAGCNTPAEPMDSGTTPMNDTGTPPVDTGVVPTDTGVVPTDTGIDAAATPNDAGTDAGTPGADANVDGGTTTGCGTAQPTLPTAGTEGLVIARDGTIYYSVTGGVARVRPDGTNEMNWLRIAGSSLIWGLALDATNTHLFVCDQTRGQVRVATNLATTPTETMLATVAQPNGITVGPDGAVYVSDFRTAGTVQRIDAMTGAMMTVTASAIAQADGVAFTDDGHLLVTAYGMGRVFSLTLDAAHHETSRTTVATGVANADGVAIDSAGVIYVGANTTVYRIGAGGTPDMTLLAGLGGAANLEWGAGVLGCHDLYVATGSGLRRIPVSVGQRAVPWH